jgi:hypothetical protein
LLSMSSHLFNPLQSITVPMSDLVSVDSDILKNTSYDSVNYTLIFSWLMSIPIGLGLYLWEG